MNDALSTERIQLEVETLAIAVHQVQKIVSIVIVVEDRFAGMAAV